MIFCRVPDSRLPIHSRLDFRRCRPRSSTLSQTLPLDLAHSNLEALVFFITIHFTVLNLVQYISRTTLSFDDRVLHDLVCRALNFQERRIFSILLPWIIQISVSTRILAGIRWNWLELAESKFNWFSFCLMRTQFWWEVFVGGYIRWRRNRAFYRWCVEFCGGLILRGSVLETFLG